jgi:hypothetical protein
MIELVGSREIVDFSSFPIADVTGGQQRVDRGRC